MARRTVFDRTGAVIEFQSVGRVAAERNTVLEALAVLTADLERSAESADGRRRDRPHRCEERRRVPPEVAARVFDDFVRFHDAREYEGSGIGLPLVRRIVERHGGRCWAEGEVENGATFSFTLE